MIRLRDVVNLASDAAFAVNRRCRVAAWNQRAETMLGYAQDEVIGRPCSDILQAVLPGGEPLCAPYCEPFRCFQSCQPRSVRSCRIRRKNGDWRSVGYSSLVTKTELHQLQNDAVLAIVFLHDGERDQELTAPDRTLHVFTLGGFGLTMGGTGVATDKWVRKQSLTLLKYLVTQAGRPVHRERILGCLWPDADARRGWDRLKVTISYLRQQFRALGMNENALTTIGQSYLLRRDAIRIDAEIFECLIAEGRALQSRLCVDEALLRFKEADRLYRGDYLEEEMYSDWCAEERERLRELHLELLADMVQCCASSGDYAEAARLCRRALVQEPCRESFHVSLMSHLIQLGHAGQATAQYIACRQVLAKELGVEPLAETQRLFRSIARDTGYARSISRVPHDERTRLLIS